MRQSNGRDTVLVTGGAGFIGSHLVQRLLLDGSRVRVLELPSAPASHLPLGRIELVRGSICARKTAAECVRGCDYVYHLAANPNLWSQQRGSFHRVNYQGTVNVLDEAVRAGVKGILHTSTESILTRAKQMAPIAEDQHVTARDAVGPYCRSKYLAERHAFRLARAGAPIIIVNPTLPVGPGDHGRSPPTQMLLDFCLGKRREYMAAELNLIDVRDIADGMTRAMKRGVPGKRYLLGHENLSIKQVFDLLAELTGLPQVRRRVPYPVALAAAYASEWFSDVVSHRSPAATVTGVKLTRRRMQFNAQLTLAELGLRPRPIRQSLADAVSWFETMGWIPRRLQAVSASRGHKS